MTGHILAEELSKAFAKREMNEADTRHQIINRLLHEILSWPQDSVKCEEHVHEGYMDFVLRGKSGRAILVIEAKKQGICFSLPASVTRNKCAMKMVRLKTLITDTNIKKAVHQVVNYCPQIGSEYACITNGHEFIIFRPYISGREFLNFDAIVIPSLNYFSEKYTEAVNLLSYESVTKDRSLKDCFNKGNTSARDLYYAKNGIGNYDASLQKNKFAKYLEPICRHYFGDISQTDKVMMKHCYVFAKGYHDVELGIRTRLNDDLSPYFESEGAVEIKGARYGGKLADRIATSLEAKNSGGDVIVFYGGKGAGKSTFLRRVLYFDPPTAIQIHAYPIIIDFLRVPQDEEQLNEYVWDQLLVALDLNDILKSPTAKLLELFHDRFEVARQQELDGFDEKSTDYIKERNRLITSWKNDKQYVVQCLQAHWKRQGKGLVVTFDNTDQLPPKLQDQCFLIAQDTARILSCTVLISMREERYCRARTVGVLDAYHGTGFHLAAPDLTEVFEKRIRLIINGIRNKDPEILDNIPKGAPLEKISSFFNSCLRQFRNKGNSLQGFLQECSRDNTRLALDFFSQFSSSGYTNIDEMIGNHHWIVNIHQVVKPMMIPDRHNYDESKSLIPNIYKCRTASQGSHFTSIRILRHLRDGLKTSPEKGGYWRVDALCDEFDATFGMRYDCESCLDVLLRHGLIEANNRLDRYCVEKMGTGEAEYIYADDIRITAFGLYLLDYLCCTFAYLELVSLDCGLAKESLYNEFCNSAQKERQLVTQDGKKRERLNLRIKRAETFIEYLEEEELRENTEFLQNEEKIIMTDIKTIFEKDMKRVQFSAKRNLNGSNK